MLKRLPGLGSPTGLLWVGGVPQGACQGVLTGGAEGAPCSPPAFLSSGHLLPRCIWTRLQSQADVPQLLLRHLLPATGAPFRPCCLVSQTPCPILPFSISPCLP